MIRPEDEDLVFGSMFTIIGAIISGVVCFFGGNNEILWLSIVGFVFFGITLFISLIPNKIGIVAVVLLAIIIFAARGWLAGMDNGLTSWLCGQNADVFFVARAFVVLSAELIIVSLINFGSRSE